MRACPRLRCLAIALLAGATVMPVELASQDRPPFLYVGLGQASLLDTSHVSSISDARVSVGLSLEYPLSKVFSLGVSFDYHQYSFNEAGWIATFPLDDGPFGRIEGETPSFFTLMVRGRATLPLITDRLFGFVTAAAGLLQRSSFTVDAYRPAEWAGSDEPIAGTVGLSGSSFSLGAGAGLSSRHRLSSRSKTHIVELFRYISRNHCHPWLPLKAGKRTYRP